MPWLVLDPPGRGMLVHVHHFVFLACNELAASCTKHRPALRRIYRILLWASSSFESAEDLPCMGADRQTTARAM